MTVFGRILSVGIVFCSLVSVQAGDTVRRAPAEDRPLSPNMDRIPDFVPVAVERPYAIDWQIALLAHQKRYVAQLLTVTITDPIETGSIRE
jgi:hypothetical protein